MLLISSLGFFMFCLRGIKLWLMDGLDRCLYVHSLCIFVQFDVNSRVVEQLFGFLCFV